MIDCNYSESLVPEAGLEPAQRQAPSDFESDASSSSTTPADYSVPLG